MYNQDSSTFIDSNILWLKLWLSSLPHPNPTIKNDKARLRAELYAARDEVRSLQRDFGSRFCRARHGCRTDINSLAAWCGETTWQIVTVNMFLMFLLFSQKLGETHGQAHHLHTKTFTVLQSMVKSLEELHAAQSGWFAETLSTVGDFKFLALIIHP